MEAIKPRQIIELWRIVLIDLQQHPKLQTIQISDTEWTNLMQRTKNPQNNNRNIRFPNQMIEQINIALEQKGPGISQPGSLKPAVGD